jgi:hypothetical protein
VAAMGSMDTGVRDSAWEEMISSTWRRPKYESGNCAEVKFEGDRVYVRSSLNHQLVTFTLEEWNNFKGAIKEGQFDQ